MRGPFRRALWLFVLSIVTAGAAVACAPAPPSPAGQDVSLILTGGTVVTMDAAGTVIENGAVAISDTAIVAVGAAAEVAAKFSARQTIDATGQIVMPGLINTHTHAPMVLYRGLADDLALMEWLTKYIFPAEKATVSAEFVRAGARLAALEMIQSGTTTYTDMYYFEDDIAQVTKDAGLRGVLGQSVIKFPVADAPTPEDALKRAEAFLAKWKDDPLITPAVAPHAPYTLEPPTLQAARALANKYGMPLLIHLAETRDEIKIIADTRRNTPARFLDSLGVWDGRSVAAHAVWLDDEDIEVLARKRVGLAHNPESNMKLASGVARVPDWISKGARAGLGTDGAASNNDLDMFDAMRTASFLQKVSTGNPEAMPARHALELATRRGAEALGMADRIGSLEVGKQADVITVDVSGARATPMFDPISHLVYVSRGDDVRNTIVAGRVLMQRGAMTTLKQDDVLKEARAMAQRVREAVGMAPQGKGGSRE